MTKWVFEPKNNCVKKMEKIDNLQWRFRARVAACISMLLSIGSLLAAVRLTLGVLAAIGEASYYYSPAFLVEVLIAAVMYDITVGILLWAVLQLFSATVKGKPADEALQKSRIWLNVNIVLLVIFGVLDIWSWNSRIVSNEADGDTSYLILSNIIGYAICSITLFIVYKFIQELEIIVSSSGCASAPAAKATNLDCVYVKK